MKIVNCMARNVVITKEATSIKEAASLLVKNRVSCMPVVDDQHSLIGIVSASDMLKVFLPDFVPLVDIDFLKDYGSLEISTEDVKKISSMTVGEIMTKEVYTVDEECSLVRALSLLNKHKIRVLPVVRDNKVIGVVANNDMIRRFLEIWEDKTLGEK